MTRPTTPTSRPTAPVHFDPDDLLDAAAVLEALPEILASERARRRLPLRAAASEIRGIGFATIGRIQRRTSETTVPHAILLLRWLAEHAFSDLE